ncbi:TlyA family RNA methyltransferase [uncultured Endozoicomonas sp.]|uniref:TlyA family RNA methyltransferase n=1 Tax=uncultured Endozoicomonas sp. TaxID=432652 RepID=UPI00261F9094|nr:TlyA family RNA methyltransferase [uncultured Endozoicomonas sp.]
MQRLDMLLVEQGKATSRTKAQQLISEGRVMVHQSGGWVAVVKPGQKYPDSIELDVVWDESDCFVSRGGLKLAGAIEKSGADFADAVVIDVGQSTGGFTDCALQSGAAKVIGIEVGHGQLVPSLRDDPRVVCLEGMNARDLSRDLLNYTTDVQGFDFAVMDVSFISQTKILPSLVPLLKPGGQLLSLVKPQFEVGSAGIGKGGIVRDANLYPQVEQSIKSFCEKLGMTVKGYFDSSITGGDGNREFFIWAEK